MRLFIFSTLFFLHFSNASELNCQLNRWSFANGSTQLTNWTAPVIHDDIYYYADLNEEYLEGAKKYRISARYSLPYGFFYVEMIDKKTDLGSHSESYQQGEAPNLTTRFGDLEVKCKFIRAVTP